MSRVIIRVHVGAGISDEDVLKASCQIPGIATKGNFNISVGQVLPSGSTRDLDLLVDGTGNYGVSLGEKTGDFYQLSVLYLIPHTLTSSKFTFKMKLPGWDDYKSAIAAIKSLESGKSYELDVTVSNPSLTITGCKIENWTTGQSLESSVY